MMTAQAVLEISFAAYKEGVEILRIIETLEAGNAKPSLDAINSPGLGDVANCIQRALFSNLIIIVARAYSHTRDGDTHLQQAFDLLDNEATKVEVGARYDGRNALDDAITFWRQCRSDPRLKRVLTLRNKQVAHLSEWDDRVTPPIITEIFEVARNTAEACRRLADGTGAVRIALGTQLIGYREKAELFWSRA